MSRIRGTGTRPEELVEAILRSLRYRFVSHEPSLPGKPDFVLTRRKVAIFVHGCFWHAHSCRRGRSIPGTRTAFWQRKKDANVKRDRRAVSALRRLGFRVIVLWECKLAN